MHYSFKSKKHKASCRVPREITCLPTQKEGACHTRYCSKHMFISCTCLASRSRARLNNTVCHVIYYTHSKARVFCDAERVGLRPGSCLHFDFIEIDADCGFAQILGLWLALYNNIYGIDACCTCCKSLKSCGLVFKS